jgi:Tfp pilus assembly PilM family ATPase
MSHALNRVLRQYVIGIDIQNGEIRLVILSHRWRSASAVRFEYAARSALVEGAYEKGEWLSPPDITQTLYDLLHGAKAICPIELKRAVMALPAHMTWLDEIDVQAAETSPLCNAQRGWLNTLEPLVLAQAEQALRIAPTEIAADWFTADPTHYPHRVTMVAAPKAAVEVRMECIAQLDMQLLAIDGEAPAALRACRFAAAHEIHAHSAYMVVWLSASEVYAYLLCPNTDLELGNRMHAIPSEDSNTAPIEQDPSTHLLKQLGSHHIARETCFLRQHLSGTLLIDRLYALMGADTPQYVWFAGEPDAFNALEARGFNTKAIGLALGCTSKRFDPTRYQLSTEKRQDVHHAKDPCFATAFGLALRGVYE